MKKMPGIFTLISFLIILSGTLMGQGKLYDGPDDPAGDPSAIRDGYMTGNRVFLYFQNTTQLSDWPKVEVSKWPDTYEGAKMVDGIGLLIGAKVYVDDNNVPVVDPDNYTGHLNTLYFLQTQYREEMDTDPTGQIEWGLYPVFGYFDENSETPAMSNDSLSWPRDGWPAAGDQLKWQGEWDGRFGRGVIYADLETYFVANDAQDQEYLGPEDLVKYYPRPGVLIGDKRPSVTVQYGNPWGGVGIRVEQRGFQWNNPQARDAIFWEYNIANISEYDLPEVAFGYWVDNAIGDNVAGAGDDDELGYFDRSIDMAYSWDIDGIGQGGYRTGTMGFAYLESPGLGYDNKDNDEDGLTDEKRDNVAVTKIGPSDGITDISKFLNFYKLSEDELREHWDADEDQDWEDGEDLNGNGVYDVGEYVGDDVGLDGVGPAELNYNGPDEGECNHKPDYEEGLGCEPNFAATDVSESDMVGLTSFQLFPIQPHRPPYNKWFRNDESMWEVIGSDTLIEYLGNISNLVETFASGPFPLFQGRRERISMSELHSFDPLEGLSSDEHSAPALFELKRIVQVIYEKDYRFAQPPKMPTLQATAGDGRVILTWDNIADTRTRDPFVGNVNDFEGYKLFRATDKKMSDVQVITDGYGTPMFNKPIFQCDIKDGLMGFTDFGLVNGMGYNLGTDSGIRHWFEDTNVQNGRTYYYAIVAYDYGAEDIGPGIAPSENNIIIGLNEAEEVDGYSKNVQIVTPRQKAAGYIPEDIEIDESQNVLGSGTVHPEILANGSLKPGHQYEVSFGLDTLDFIEDYDHGIYYTNNSIQVFDLTDSIQVYLENSDNFPGTNLVYDDTLGNWYINTQNEITTDVFDGLVLNVALPIRTAQYNYAGSKWVTGTSPITITPTKTESKYFPWDYDIIFTDDVSYTGRGSTTWIRDKDHIRLTRNLLTMQDFNFYVVNKSFPDSLELMDMIVHDLDQDGQFDMLIDRIYVGAVDTNGKWVGTVFGIDFLSAFGDEELLPKADDVYRITFNRPFFTTDKIKFSVVQTDTIDRRELKATMKDIKVVPNPYVATNAMESSVANWFLNQRRQLLFTHLPARCTIRIFTVSGVLVDVIKVENDADNGIAHWDLLTCENLEVAAGMYIFHVKSDLTGDEKVGKFAIIK
ncbi:MAG: hypothetical protein JXR87_01940 [Candidatus Marinimicrobia bacterium]|nr:hypothetical protein [Candidatus Neomarinimicrobiota bacterium]